MQDSAGLARFLGHHFRPHYKAILTGDAGILILSAMIQPVSCSSGSRWAHMQTSIRTAGLESAAAINMDLWSVHGPVRPSTFWTDDVGPALATSRIGSPLPDLIIGADWNALPDPIRDSLHGTGASCSWSPIAAVLAAHQLGDVDRILRPEERVFSRIVRGPGHSISSAKRLDSIWASPRLLPLASPARYVDTTSDHRAVSIAFDLGQTRPSHLTGHSRPWSRWTLHPGTLRDPTFRRVLNDFATDITPPPGTAFLPDPIAAWTDFERRLRSVAQTEARSVGQSHLIARTAARDIELRLEGLNLDLPGAGNTLAELTAALLVARQIRLDTAQMSAVDPRLVNVFRPSTWLNRANDTSEVTRISSLLNSSGHGGTTDTHLLDTVWAFYQSLYTPNPSSALRTSHITTLLSTPTNRISTHHGQSLSLPFTHAEISDALSAAQDTSAPGPNGLTYPLLKLVAPLATDLLTHMANDMREGNPVPVPLRTTLLYKRGPRNDIGNYRPISVSNVHIRVLTRAAARRLQSALATTLPWYQAAFMPGRRTTSIVGALLGCAEHTYAEYPGYPTSFVAIFLDQQKAYDRVDRSWLWAVLLRFGVPHPFIAFLQSLYSSPTTQVVVNGLLTYLVPLAAGLLQGDPLSCALYNMALQPLLDALAHLQVGIVVPGLGRMGSLAFADDVTLLLPLGPEGLQQWSQVLHALSLYESASGARLNRAKSGYFVVSKDPTRTDPLLQALQAWGLRPLTPANGELLHLGHPLQLGTPGTPCPISFADRLAAIGTRIKLMETSDTDLLLRVRLCYSLLTPMLWHHTAVGGLPLNAGKLVRQTLRPFLYKGNTAWLDHDTICRPRPCGGLGLVDPDAMFTGQAISLLAKHLLDDDGYGPWLRNGLSIALHHTYGSSPSVLLLPGSTAHKRLSHEITRTEGFWGRLLHALCQVRVTLDPCWSTLPVLALLELPWHDATSLPLAPDPSAPRPTEKRRKKISAVINQGWQTWGDVLWHHPPPPPRATPSPTRGLWDHRARETPPRTTSLAQALPRPPRALSSACYGTRYGLPSPRTLKPTYSRPNYSVSTFRVIQTVRDPYSETPRRPTSHGIYSSSTAPPSTASPVARPGSRKPHQRPTRSTGTSDRIHQQHPQRNTKKAALLPAAEVALGVVSSAVAAAAAASVLPVSNDQQMQQQQRQQQQEQQQQPQLQQPTPLAQHDSSPPARTELGGIDGAARDAAVFEMQKEPISSSTSLLASNASMAPASSGRLSVEASAPPAQQTAGEFSNDSFLGTNSSAPRHNHESTGDPSNEEEEDENGMPKMGEGEKMNEKASRLLWLSTMDALDYLEKEEDWKYIFDDRKRARIVREKYWRMVRD
ncbi:hypothetical protein CF335_g7216, partial [Tilletia laevis]